jgi:hypothetical protein
LAVLYQWLGFLFAVGFCYIGLLQDGGLAGQAQTMWVLLQVLSRLCCSLLFLACFTVVPQLGGADPGVLWVRLLNGKCACNLLGETAHTTGSVLVLGKKNPVPSKPLADVSQWLGHSHVLQTADWLLLRHLPVLSCFAKMAWLAKCCLGLAVEWAMCLHLCKKKSQASLLHWILVWKNLFSAGPWLVYLWSCHSNLLQPSNGLGLLPAVFSPASKWRLGWPSTDHV